MHVRKKKVYDVFIEMIIKSFFKENFLKTLFLNMKSNELLDVIKLNLNLNLN